jgi:hypothetical protein
MHEIESCEHHRERHHAGERAHSRDAQSVCWSVGDEA